MLRDLTLNFNSQILIFQYCVYVFSVITTQKHKYSAVYYVMLVCMKCTLK